MVKRWEAKQIVFQVEAIPQAVLSAHSFQDGQRCEATSSEMCTTHLSPSLELFGVLLEEKGQLGKATACVCVCCILFNRTEVHDNNWIPTTVQAGKSFEIEGSDQIAKVHDSLSV